jgi:hypothetical protein
VHFQQPNSEEWVYSQCQAYHMFVVQALSMGVLVLALEMPGDQQLAHLLAVGGTLFYVFTFALGAGPATALIIPELSTTRLRAKTMAVSLCTHWVCIFLTCRYLVLSDLRSLFNTEDSFEVLSLHFSSLPLQDWFANLCS